MMVVLLRILGLSFAIRLFALSALLLASLLPDYDTSSQHLHEACGLTGDKWLWRVLTWDSVFYTDLACNGYQYEQQYAFFPLLPALLRAAPRTVLPACGLALSLLCHSLGSGALLLLGRSVTGDPQLAALAALLYAASPASPFHAAVYTEAVFGLLTLAGCCCLHVTRSSRGPGRRGGGGRAPGGGGRGAAGGARLLGATACFTLATCVRSNGVINAGFLLHWVMGACCQLLLAPPFSPHPSKPPSAPPLAPLPPPSLTGAACPSHPHASAAAAAAAGIKEVGGGSQGSRAVRGGGRACRLLSGCPLRRVCGGVAWMVAGLLGALLVASPLALHQLHATAALCPAPPGPRLVAGQQQQQQLSVGTMAAAAAAAASSHQPAAAAAAEGRPHCYTAAAAATAQGGPAQGLGEAEAASVALQGPGEEGAAAQTCPSLGPPLPPPLPPPLLQLPHLGSEGKGLGQQQRVGPSSWSSAAAAAALWGWGRLAGPPPSPLPPPPSCPRCPGPGGGGTPPCPAALTAGSRARCNGSPGGSSSSGPPAGLGPAWCPGRSGRPAWWPAAYSAVQAQYWGLGLLAYWRPQQVPNFLLAAPVLIITAGGVMAYCRAQPRLLLLGGLPALQHWAGGRRGGRRPRPSQAPPSPSPSSSPSPSPSPRPQQGEGGNEEGVPGAGGPASGRWEGRGGEVGGAGEEGGAKGGARPPAAAAAAAAAAGAQASGAGQQLQGVGQGAGREDDKQEAGEEQGEGGGVGWGEGGCAAGQGFTAPGVAVYLYPWAFSAATALLLMHVQVSTRFLSTCPALYWWAAHLMLHGTPAMRRGLWAWALAWAGLGTVLLPNFYPWT